MEIKFLIEIVLVGLLIGVLVFFLFGPETGLTEEIKESFTSALKSLLPEKGEEVSAGAASIPETHRLEILKLQETIKTMLASNGRCFASYGGFS